MKPAKIAKPAGDHAEHPRRAVAVGEEAARGRPATHQEHRSDGQDVGHDEHDDAPEQAHTPTLGARPAAAHRPKWVIRRRSNVRGMATKRKDSGFSAEERAAMRERAKEVRAAKGKADSEAEVLAKIAELPQPDRDTAERLHALVRATAPELTARTWYGMPAYAKDGKVLCFFQGAKKFKTRYATLGFSDAAALDDGALWPVAFALAELTGDAEAEIVALLKRAVGAA